MNPPPAIGALPFIEITHVGKSYGAFRVLEDCSANIAQGEVVVVCGPSGSGKSTLLKTVNGLEPFQQGSIRVDDILLQPGRDAGPALRAKVGMVFQHFELFPHLDVIGNLKLAQMKVLGRGAREAEDYGLAYLERVGLADQRGKYPAHLSGGQQQRVAIARALTMDPAVMLFDEPTSALDPEMVGEVLDVMTGLAAEGMTMLCVTHEMGFARQVAGRVLFMDQGRIVDDARSAIFFGAPEAISPRAREFLSRLRRY